MPQQLLTSVADQLVKTTELKLSSNLRRALEPLLAYLPLDVENTRRILRVLHQYSYYSHVTAKRVAKLRCNHPAWVNVLTDEICPGGRVPIIALLSTQDGITVLPWPSSVPPFALQKSDIPNLGGQPVAILFPYRDDSLRYPMNMMSPFVLKQRSVLEEQGFTVLLVYSQLGHAHMMRCQSVAEIINVARQEPRVS